MAIATMRRLLYDFQIALNFRVRHAVGFSVEFVGVAACVSNLELQYFMDSDMPWVFLGSLYAAFSNFMKFVSGIFKFYVGHRCEIQVFLLIGN